jgi:hypothetical protein
MSAEHGKPPKTHCPAGHEYTAENKLVDKNSIFVGCRACKDDRGKEKRAAPSIGVGTAERERALANAVETKKREPTIVDFDREIKWLKKLMSTYGYDEIWR